MGVTVSLPHDPSCRLEGGFGLVQKKVYMLNENVQRNHCPKLNILIVFFDKSDLLGHSAMFVLH